MYNLLFGTIGWSMIYNGLQHHISDPIKVSRAYSSIHAFIVFSLCTLYLMFEQYNIAIPGAKEVLTLPVCYAIVDLFSMIDPKIYAESPRGTIIHHIMLIGCLLKYKSSHSKLIMTALLSEITNPLLNEAQNALDDQNISKAKKISYVLIPSFLVFRILNFCNLVLQTYRQNLYTVSGMSVLLTIMNVYWFGKICNKALKFRK